MSISSIDGRSGPLVLWAVEHSPSVRALLRLSLKEPEFVLRFAADVPALKDLFSLNRPDILLVNSSLLQDLEAAALPGGGKNPGAEPPPLIILAGAFDPVPSAPLCSQKSRAFIQMPFDSASLVALVRSLGGKGGNRSAPDSGAPPPGESAGGGPDLVRMVRRIVMEELQIREKERGIPEEPE